MNPYFSICIPQYNRTSFLLKALEACAGQTFRDFEVCISDDLSPEARHSELQQFLRESGIKHRYEIRPINGRYDANLRSAIALASGKYLLLMGNDDRLASPDALGRFHTLLEQHKDAEVAIANYRDLSSGRVFRRSTATRLLPGGWSCAIGRFRNFSFVSGVILDRQRAQAFETISEDGSEMYQMYLGARMLAKGGDLLEIDEVLIEKDIPIPGEIVDSYARRPRHPEWPIREQLLPLRHYAATAARAILPATPQRQHATALLRIFWQVLAFTYPPWLVEYRRVQSWGFAAGVAWGMRPRRILERLPVPLPVKAWISILFGITSLAGLLFPIALFERLQPFLHRLAKRG